MSDNYLEEVRQLEKDCDQMGRDFVSQLKERTGKQLDVQGIPTALAAAFDQLVDYNQVDVQCFYLKQTLENFIGMRLERYAPGIESLHQRLTEIGATSFKNKVNNGGDNYVYCLPSTSYWRYTLVCETQNRFFIVLMRYGSRAADHPDDLRSRWLETDSNTTAEEIEQIVANSYRPQIYIAQFPWAKSKKAITKIESHANMDVFHLPVWMDDRNPDGYVAYLKNGQVEGAIHHYTKISYCFYSLASFIDCKDELEMD